MECNNIVLCNENTRLLSAFCTVTNKCTNRIITNLHFIPSMVVMQLQYMASFPGSPSVLVIACMTSDPIQRK